jgi:hypothetical protein
MLQGQRMLLELADMKIIRITKTPTQHAAIVLYNEGDPFELAIARGKDSTLQFQVEDHTHKFTVSLNKNEEAELLSKLKFICN